MVQIKTDPERFLAKPDPAIRVVLIYGDDEGLVSERARRFVAAIADDPLAIVHLDIDAIASGPGRLADEANAVPMFGGQRAIVVTAHGNRQITPALEAVLDAPPVDSWVVVTAGELRKSSPLRRLCETNKAAASIACYADDDRNLDRVIDEETARTGLTIADDARDALKRLTGADRGVSRSEIAKLCLYATDAGAITTEDVRAVIGDASAFAIEETIDMMALGDAAALDRDYRRLVAAGTSGSMVAGAALRHFNFLQKARAAYDDGTPAPALVDRARPPIFFKRQPNVARQIEMWSPTRIERALSGLDQAMLDSRLNGPIADEVVGQALHLVAALAAQTRRRS